MFSLSRLASALRQAFGPLYLQGDQSVANQAGAAFRADLNNELQALATNSSGTSSPGTTYAYQWWADTSNGLLKQRNAANTGWLVRGTLAETFVINRSSNTILAAGDYGRTFRATAAFTQTLTAAATLGDGWWCEYRNDSTGLLIFDPNSSETIDGTTLLALQPGEACIINCNGTSFYTVGRAVAKNSAQLLENIGIEATVAANVLTFALKDAQGNDPSPGSPVRIGFRNATLTTGTPNVREVTAALSLAISAGSTLGFGGSETRRVYLGAIDNAGTVELVAWCSVLGTVAAPSGLFSISESALVSTTAEGGAGAADSAGVLYSTTARSNVAVRVIGYIEIQTGATPGNWSNAPTVKQVMGPGVRRTGDRAQPPQITLTGSSATGTTTIPHDNTIPQNTEGTSFMTVTATPTSALNLLTVDWLFNCATSGALYAQTALFRDSTANAVRAAGARLPTGALLLQINGKHLEMAGSVASTTYSLRAGPDTAATMTFNGEAGAGLYGGALGSYLILEEIFA